MAPDLTHRVLSCAFEVQNTLGSGFLEKVYERSLLKELTLKGIKAVAQPSVPVYYKEEKVGDYHPDLLIEDELLVELKCAESLGPAHIAQCLNYLKATGLRLCLLLNFEHPRLQIKRIIL